MPGTPAEQPFYLQLDYTAPHGDFRRPAGPEPAPRHYDWFKGARLPARPLRRLRRGQRHRQAALHPRSRPPHAQRQAHLPRLLRRSSSSRCARSTTASNRSSTRSAALHRLRNTYILFTSDNGFFFGEHRLIGGKFLAYEPATHLPFLIRGPGIKPGTSTGELAANIDIAPTILELAGVDSRQEHRRPLDGPLPARPEPAHPAAAPLRVLRRDQRRRSRAAAPNRRPPANARRPAPARPRGDGGATASILAPPKDYEGIRLGPYKYIAWPDGEKELYDINKDPYELNNMVRIPNYFPIRNYLHREPS